MNMYERLVFRDDDINGARINQAHSDETAALPKALQVYSTDRFTDQIWQTLTVSSSHSVLVRTLLRRRLKSQRKLGLRLYRRSAGDRVFLGGKTSPRCFKECGRFWTTAMCHRMRNNSGCMLNHPAGSG